MMNEDEVVDKLDNLVELMTSENLASLSDEDLEKLGNLLDKIDEIVEG